MRQGVWWVVETYRVDDPRSTVPGRGVDGGPQVEEENSHDASAG